MKKLLIVFLFLALPAVAATHTIIRKKAYASAGGPDVWYWSGGLGDSSYTSTTAAGWDPHLNAYGADITVGQAGTCTKIAAYVGSTSGSTTVKLALYDGSNNLLANGSVVVAQGSPSWQEVTVSQSVSAANYRVMISHSINPGTIGYNTSGPDGLFDDVAHASFPPATLTPGTDTDLCYGVKMYVD